MSNLSGWKLAGRLAQNHLGALGDKIASAIAAFDPATATRADRDQLAENLRDIGERFSRAETDFNKENQDVLDLQESIARDEAVAAKLIARIQDGEQIDDSTLNLFIEELEAQKARLPQELQEAAAAKEVMTEIQGIMKELSDRLAQFDARAAQVKRELSSAQAQLQNQQLRAEQLAEARAIAGAGGASNGMSALEQRAAELRAKTAGLRTLNDVESKPAEDQKKLAALRASVLTGTPAAPTALDRLRALSKPATV